MLRPLIWQARALHDLVTNGDLPRSSLVYQVITFHLLVSYNNIHVSAALSGSFSTYTIMLRRC
jgi:hypothetical protein